MRVLDRKLLRDVRRLWAQVLAVALVVAAGVAVLVLATGAYRSLDETRAAYYERYRFADIFATLTRAPEGLKLRILEIPGVAAVETTIQKYALLDIPGMAEPATGVTISLPAFREPALNRLYLRSGRFPEPLSTGEVTVNEAFAKAHGFGLGDTFQAILNGRKRTLVIVGIALSPEYVYAMGPGDLMPDDRRFGVLWMPEKALAAAFDLDGAFNAVALKVVQGGNPAGIIAALDALVARYGGTGAIERKDQQSHAFLDGELQQLAAMSRVMPPIFLFVSAFLINLVLSRQIALEREQIGLFKAVGYPPGEIAGHYLKFVLAVVAAGLAMGFGAGVWLGRGLTRLYAEFYHFPFLVFSRAPDVYAAAAVVSAGAGFLGALRAVAAVLALAPAVAMQPPAPVRYRQVVSGRLGKLFTVSQLTLMSLRHLVRWPLRTGLTVLGMALATALLIMALFSFDSVEFMIDVTYFRTERQHATLSFAERKGPAALEAAWRLPGVLKAEPYRVVPARLVHGHLSRRAAIEGKPQEMDLSRVLDSRLVPVRLPEHGLAVNGRLAELLRLRRGDVVEVEILEGRRARIPVTVSTIIESYIGLGARMDLSALNGALDEGPQVSGVHIAYDPALEPQLFTAIKATPAVAAISLQRLSLRRFRETLAQNIGIMTAIYTAFAGIVAFGVVYNSARVQLSEHARELASLRVLGFTRGEVSRVLLGELAVMVFLALPLGWLLGTGFAWLTVQGFANDLYRIPFVIERATYAKASLAVLAAAAVSAVIVHRRIAALDLVAVLKTRD